jgi:hypothetical protein
MRQGRGFVGVATGSLAVFVLVIGPTAAAPPASAGRDGVERDSITREVVSRDVVIYGGSSGGIAAAVQAARMGRSVVVVSPDRHLGGLSSGGLGMTDTGNKEVIGGLAREFYHHVWRHYERPEAWRWQERSAYGNRGQGTPAIDGAARTMWIFEPHVAERIFEELVAEHGIEVVRDEWLDRDTGVRKVGPRIESITTLSGRTFTGRMFIDATYEGDLMAAAGVDYHVGREANAVYGEEHNGVQVGVLHHGHHFGRVSEPISPYRVPGDPTSGVLPRISTEPPGEFGTGDHRVQAYCFRTCFTNVPANRVPFPKPAGYDPGQYELLVRIFDAGWREFFRKFDPIPNGKTDTNNHGPFSFDNIGFNEDYPEASYERRREIVEEHRVYQQGLLWFVANDPRVPAEVREELNRWGLAADEFPDSGHWPHQLYVREARRMVGSFVMTEGELRKWRPTPDSVGMGSYTIDSHNVQRYVTPEGHVQNEGDIGVGTGGPYAIAYGSLVPKRGQCDNLLVPVCVSASHIAYGSIRMEPVFMILGQSAATAASLAIDRGLAVQDVPYDTLRARLLADGQVLEHAELDGAGGGRRGIAAATLDGVVVDDRQATFTGDWQQSTSAPAYLGGGYRHDGRTADGRATARFEARLPAPGRYHVFLTAPPNANRARNVPVEVHHEEGVARRTIDQRAPRADRALHWTDLGTYRFAGTGVVVVANAGTDGYVVADGVRWVPAGD